MCELLDLGGSMAYPISYTNTGVSATLK